MQTVLFLVLFAFNYNLHDLTGILPTVSQKNHNLYIDCC